MGWNRKGLVWGESKTVLTAPSLDFENGVNRKGFSFHPNEGLKDHRLILRLGWVGLEKRGESKGFSFCPDEGLKDHRWILRLGWVGLEKGWKKGGIEKGLASPR